MKPLLIDCTDTLKLLYDRGKDGYGVPVPGVQFRGTQRLHDVLTDIRRDLEQIEWWDDIGNFLTAGLYVDKAGAHGDGIAWDFDGVVLKPALMPSEKIILMYKSGYPEKIGSYYEKMYSLTDRIKTRFDCLMSLRFGKLLTAGYNKAHEDHIHADLSRPVKWRGSRSQVVCLQETLNAWFNAGLKVDGIYGDKTKNAWTIPGINGHEGLWINWLKLIAFDPPKDGA